MTELQDEKIRNIEKSMEKMAHHIEVLNDECGDTQRNVAFIRATIDAIADINTRQDERTRTIEKRQWFIVTGIIITYLTLLINLL
jgi:ribosomal protein S5